MLDQRIKAAIRQAVEKNNQPIELADKIIAWIESLSEGNEAITDRDKYLQRCELCFNTIIVGENLEE